MTTSGVPVPPAGEPPRAPESSARPCHCGHGRVAHEHYRAGTDCALCDCARYARPLLDRLGLSRRR